MPALLWIGLLFYFNQDKKKEIPISLQKTEQDVDGMVLMDRYCFACHHPGMGQGPAARIGPPMFRVREHYFREGMKREEFVEPIIAFVQHPGQGKSKMPGAIRNFGLMPALSIDEKDLSIIVSYIYDHDLASEEWITEWMQFKDQENQPL